MSETRRRGEHRAPTVIRSVLAVAVAGVIALAAGGCGSSSHKSGGGTTAAASSSSSSDTLSAAQLAAIPEIVRLACSKNEGLKGKTIGVSWAEESSLVNELNNGLEKFNQLSHCGVTLKIVNSNGNNSQQVVQDQQLIAQHINLLWEQPAAPGGFSQVIAAAKAAHVPVVNFSSVAISGATMNAEVSQTDAGALDAAPVCSWIKANQGGHAQVGIVVSPTDPGFKARAVAFKAAVAKQCPGMVDIVQTAPGGYTTATAAEKTVLSMIQGHPDLKVIWADWDTDTLGAVAAAKDAGKTDPKQFYIAGNDGTAAQVQAMSKPNSVLQASSAEFFNYDPGNDINNMLQMLEGKTLPPTRVMVPLLVTPSTLTSFNGLAGKVYSVNDSDFFDKIEQFYSSPVTTEHPLPTGTPQANTHAVLFPG